MDQETPLHNTAKNRTIYISPGIIEFTVVSMLTSIINLKYYTLVDNVSNLYSTMLYRATTVTINGITYKIGTVVVTGYLAGVEMPNLVVIRKIIYLTSHKCYFQIKKQLPIHFDSHFHAFQVAESQEAADVFIVTNAELFTHEPMHLVCPISAEERNASWFVVLPYSATIHIDSNSTKSLCTSGLT